MLVKLLKEIEDLEGYVVQQELRDLPGTDEVRPHLILNQEPISKHSLKNLLVLGSNILEFLCQLIIAKCDDCPFQLRHFLVVLQQLMLCLDVVVQVVDLVLVVLLLLLRLIDFLLVVANLLLEALVLQDQLPVLLLQLSKLLLALSPYLLLVPEVSNL